MIELKLMKYAATLAETRNFARAAEALGIAQPSLSRSIAVLERKLGVPLFERRRDGVVTTALGKLLVERAHLLLAGASSLRSELKGLSGSDTSRLRLGVGPYAAEISTSRAVALVLAENPHLLIDVTVDDADTIVAGVLSGRFDLGVAVVRAIDVGTNLHVVALPTHPLYVCVRSGHPLADRRGLTLADVFAFPLVAPMVAGDVAANAASLQGAGTVDLASGYLCPPIHVNNFSLARGISFESDAVLVGSRSMLHDDVASRRLVVLDVRIDTMRTTYSLVWHRGRPPLSSAARLAALIERVEHEVAGLEPQGRWP
jgi:DNA-binding transcriptional LysR family regulator